MPGEVKRRVISLFTGAGGLDVGLEAAGFETVVATEFDQSAAETLRGNRSWPVLERDIHNVPSEEILDVAGLEVGEADLLVGGPPCQPFSKSGYWATGDALRLNDPRASTLDEYMRVLCSTKPTMFLLENVSGLVYKNKDEGLGLLRRAIETLNQTAGTDYSFAVGLLNGADYGVPQVRDRVFVVGHREGEEFSFPTPTHADPDKAQVGLSSAGREPYRTAWDAIGDLEDEDDPALAVTGKWAALLPSIPEGENYLFHTDRGAGLPLFGWRRHYWSFLLKLAKRRPSRTITAQPGSAIGPFHWRNRRLSMRELARLQTFPDGFHINGSRTAYQRQLGNAVPCALAEVLGLEIRGFLGDEVRGRPSLVPEVRTPVPPEEFVEDVPEQYLDRVGHHEPHPGTGLGYGAQAREEVARPG